MSLASLGSAIENAYQSTEQWIKGVGDGISRASFEAWATSEAHVAAYLAIPIYETARGDSISNLTSDMLRMYLNGTTADANTIRKVANEIKLSATFGRLAETTRRAINATATRFGRVLNHSELSTVASQVINKQYRDPSTGRAMYFSNADRGLQGVVGGITGLAVDRVSLQGSAYEIHVAISDSYDFDNQQNTAGDPDLAAYVRFRDQLSEHIRRQRYREFLYDYHKSLYFTDPLSRSRTFAAFMVAIERNGLTPGGVKWKAIVPFTGIINHSR